MQYLKYLIFLKKFLNSQFQKFKYLSHFRAHSLPTSRGHYKVRFDREDVQVYEEISPNFIGEMDESSSLHTHKIPALYANTVVREKHFEFLARDCSWQSAIFQTI